MKDEKFNWGILSLQYSFLSKGVIKMIVQSAPVEDFEKLETLEHLKSGGPLRASPSSSAASAAPKTSPQVLLGNSAVALVLQT